MEDEPTNNEESLGPPISSLTKVQRRILGTILEKAFTVPDQYPMTLKAVTTGCNQKNNRDPITNYSEEEVQTTLDDLRELGLVGEIHTEGGRTPRYRHYMRRKFKFSEPQLAILTELLLRGQQQVGELRSRASRMVAIETLDQLRAEIEGLITYGAARANGPLERRGVEADHNWYAPQENRQMQPVSAGAEDSSELASDNRSATVQTSRNSLADQSSSLPSDSGRFQQLERAHQELNAEVARLKNRVDELSDFVDRMRRELGVS